MPAPIINAERRAAWQPYLAGLRPSWMRSERNWQLIVDRYGRGKTLRELAAGYGISAWRVNQILTGADDLREHWERSHAKQTNATTSDAERRSASHQRGATATTAPPRRALV